MHPAGGKSGGGCFRVRMPPPCQAEQIEIMNALQKEARAQSLRLTANKGVAGARCVCKERG